MLFTRLIWWGLTGLLVVSETGAEKARLRVAHIGLELDGSWRFSKDVSLAQDGELVGVADPHPDLLDRARKAFPQGVRFYTDYRVMLGELRPDAVTSTTPNAQHLEIVRECAKRGIHVWFQKPMATSARDARQMEQLASQRGITLMISDHTRFSPAAQEIGARLKAGELGPLQRLHIVNRFSASKVLSPYYAGYFREPARHGGGAIMDQGTYGINWAICLLGRPDSVFATGRQLNQDPRVPLEDHGWVIMNYGSAVAIVEGGWWAKPDFGRGGRGEFQASGPKGSLTRLNDQVVLEPAIPENDPAAVSSPQPLTPRAVPPHMADGISHFLHSVRYQKPVAEPHTPRVNVIVNEVVEAAYESIRTGRAVPLAATNGRSPR
ncbi:MAG: Gfo/Idh/MocA family oxidoreductase [Acidobacteria bacterium]|nr:Gfo/Idh/MocA family oxidoreductase [Acidobacteriota bacterium]